MKKCEGCQRRGDAIQKYWEDLANASYRRLTGRDNKSAKAAVKKSRKTNRASDTAVSSDPATTDGVNGEPGSS